MQRARLYIGAAQQNAQLFGPNQADLPLHRKSGGTHQKNSFFDAVKRTAEIPMSELNTLRTKLGVKCFKDKEYQFLHECCTAMRPLTAALDILQGDRPYGTLLPI